MMLLLLLLLIVMMMVVMMQLPRVSQHTVYSSHHSASRGHINSLKDNASYTRNA